MGDPQVCSAANALLGQHGWVRWAAPAFGMASQKALGTPGFFNQSSCTTAKKGWWLWALCWCLPGLKQEAIHGGSSHSQQLYWLWLPALRSPQRTGKLCHRRGLSQWTGSDAFSRQQEGWGYGCLQSGNLGERQHSAKHRMKLKRTRSTSVQLQHTNALQIRGSWPTTLHKKQDQAEG